MAFTFFFRDTQTLELAVQQTLPHCAGRTRVRIWDAGCATGQEVYSLAILFAERMTHFGFRNLYISATDVDETDKFGPTLLEGRYPTNEIERVPVPIREKYFTREADAQLRVAQPLRDRVTFRKHDLLSLEPIGDGFSLVVCKNVLLHFTEEQRVQVIRMFYDALEPDGCLAMEQTQKLPPGTEHLFVQVVPGTQLFAKLKTGIEPVQVTRNYLER